MPAPSISGLARTRARTTASPSRTGRWGSSCLGAAPRVRLAPLQRRVRAQRVVADGHVVVARVVVAERVRAPALAQCGANGKPTGVYYQELPALLHHGNETIRLIFEENQRTLSGYDVVPVELIDGGEKVVAVAQTVGSGPVSQIAVEDQFAFVFTFAGERCVREQAFRNKEEALEAAGLSE
jgi:ketosteroid isomerase-like protein